MSKTSYVLVRQRRPQPRSDDDEYYEEDDKQIVYNLTVYDDVPERVDTGLVSPDGESIFAVTREPIGFIHFE